MRMRPITALVAALALLAAVPPVVRAQDPTPSPTATAGQSASSADAPKDASKEVKRIYDDYRRDGRIEACDHTRANLQAALDTIQPAFDSDYPDFRVGLEAAITEHAKGRCPADAGASPTATPAASASPAPTATAQAGSGPGAGAP